MKKFITKKEFTRFIFFISLTVFALIISGCNNAPTKDEVEKLVRKYWATEGAPTFLMDKTINVPYKGTGLEKAGYVAPSAIIDDVEIVERTKAEEREGQDKEVRMIIKVSGTVETFNHGEFWYSKPKSLGTEKYRVNSVYYFKQNKYGEWRVTSSGEIAPIN